MEDVAEIRRLHFVEHVTVSELAKQFKLSRPTIRKHLNGFKPNLALIRNPPFQVP
jgi:DNA-binding transcriptional regulator LsrR (DeoR family)